ncbi:hypothetical protein P7K49_020256 [Saguinus oedipus]|uniref:Protein phosphatase n=1 Tax=Saguinus oedipus TaxID=9490 RepID=A0ABQ9UZQ3_SAGOE|nr:hypothetical protein P7K49_020256 [Saguinus oedipus]
MAAWKLLLLSTLNLNLFLISKLTHQITVDYQMTAKTLPEITKVTSYKECFLLKGPVLKGKVPGMKILEIFYHLRTVYNVVVHGFGVADGVGGWRDYGVDPSQFSGTLMRTCERLVKEGRFVPSNPIGILTTSYCELLQNKVPLLGSSTACIVVLDRTSHRLHTANLGDSGFLVVRGGEVVHRSDEQQHYFNTPFQLSIAPPEAEGVVLSDRAGAVLLYLTCCLWDRQVGAALCWHASKVEVASPGAQRQLASM